MIAKRLAGIVGDENLLAEEALSGHTTFELGGPAQFMVLPHSVEEVCQVVQACAQEGICLRVMGLGSNILASDDGVRGVVMKLADNLAGIQAQGNVIRCQAGASNEEVARAALDAGLTGYEFACGIPGSIGGAAIMNAGAYDGEFSQVALGVTCVDAGGNLVTLDASEADWGYRHSRMMDEGMIVVEATLQLEQGNPREIEERMDELQRRRQEKQPLEMPSAGSTFKRPQGHFAGKLIQDSQLMGHTVGGAQVSTKHAGFVVNFNHGTAADVLQVIADVQEKVKADSGVVLEPEVRMWGFDEEEEVR